jgi:Sm_like domain
MSVKLIKLITGEELLGEVASTSPIPTSVVLKNPVRIVVMPNKIDPKTPNIGFAPWAEFSDEKEFVLDKSHILCIMTPIIEFVNQYNSMFGGLVVPKSNLIIPGQ